MTFAAAWKHQLQIAGFAHFQPPGFFGVTPTTIINGTVGSRTAWTVGELTTGSTDDGNFVVNFLDMPQFTTGRSSHLFRYDGLASLTAVSDLKRYHHLIVGIDRSYETRLYIWNDTLSAFEELASSTGTGMPRTIGPVSAAGPNFNDYRNGSGQLFFLLWDYEGVHQSGTGAGCVHSDTIITLGDGTQKKAIDIVFGDMVMGVQDGAQVARKVDEVTEHTPELRAMVEVHCGDKSFHVNDSHLCMVDGNIDGVRARDLKEGDLIPDINGATWPVTQIIASEIVCAVMDIELRNHNYMVNDGLLVRTMPFG